MADFTENQKTLLGLYALIGAGSIMMLIPHVLIPWGGVACAFVGLIAAYYYRFRAEKNTETHDHTTYIIRTFWWSSLVLTVGIILFGCIIYNNGDLTSINVMMDQAQKGIILSESDMLELQIKFVQMNKGLILISAAICLLPYPIFLIYRIFKGVRSLVS